MRTAAELLEKAETFEALDALPVAILSPSQFEVTAWGQQGPALCTK